MSREMETVILTYAPHTRLRRFFVGTRYRRIQTRCSVLRCRKPITVLVAQHQDEDTMRRYSSCLACEGRTPADMFRDMVPHQSRRKP